MKILVPLTKDEEIESDNIKKKRLFLRLGTRCNNNCIHCTIFDIKQYKDRSLNEIKKELKIASEEGYKELVLIRGEPTIRPDFFEIGGYAKKLSYELIQIQTNGRMLSYLPFLKKCIKYGVNMFEVSLYAHYGEMHDYISNVKGSFAQTVSGIKNLVKLKQNFILTVPIIKTNYKYLHEIVHFANNLGVKKLQFNVLRVLEETKKEKVMLEEVVPYLIKAIDIAKEFGIDIKIEAMPFCLIENYKDYIISESLTNIKIVDLNRTETNLKKLKDESRINLRECSSCIYRDECPRTWKSYEEKNEKILKNNSNVCLKDLSENMMKEFKDTL